MNTLYTSILHVPVSSQPPQHASYKRIADTFAQFCQANQYPLDIVSTRTHDFIKAVLDDTNPENQKAVQLMSSFCAGKRQWNLLYCYLRAQDIEESRAIQITWQVNSALTF